jgi:HPt (histidine-containing phosphotransfer) domain-containing protein
MDFDINNPPDAVFDWDVTLKHTNDNKELAIQLCHMLLTSLNDFQEDLISAYQAKDLSKLKSSAHKLNGGLCYVTAPKLHHLSTLLESACRDDNQEVVDQIITKLPETFDELATELRKIA